MSTYSVHAVRRVFALLSCACAGVSLWVVPAAGQAVPEEGSPAKRVFQDEPPAFPEACGALFISDEFGEGCAEDKGPDAVGGVAGAGGFPNASPAPVLRTAPRLECPAAVFVEELETGVIDCRAYDEAGEETLDYYWEPAAGAPGGYLDAPRLIGEDTPSPLVVAPSAPAYAALESFASEDATLRYRYRLTATSRVTGLSSRAEVEVFVLLLRPSVYCPLEYEVSAGSEVVLSCEGADPLSFRMDYEAGSEASWEWEGLWGSSASLLSASDTPSPLFRAPSDDAGETHHYIASMTTTSSGAPLTARRRVSVRVVEGEEREAMESFSAPSITCPDSPYKAYEGSADITLDCDATDAPAGATYEWTNFDAHANVANRLTNADSLDATFLIPPAIDSQEGGKPDVLNGQYVRVYNYTVTMHDGGAPVPGANANVSVTVLAKPNIGYCLVSAGYSFDEGESGEPLRHCESDPTGAPGDSPVYAYAWSIAEGTPTPSDALSLLSSAAARNPVFTPPADVAKDVLYQYDMTISADNANDYVMRANVQVIDLDAGALNLACARVEWNVYAGKPNITLECDAPGAPSDATWTWTARAPTPNADKLTNPNIRNPEFIVPSADKFYVTQDFYYTVSVSAGGKSEAKDVVVEVIPAGTIVITCNSEKYFFDGGDDEEIGRCSFAHGRRTVDPGEFEYQWVAHSTTDPRFTNGTNPNGTNTNGANTNSHLSLLSAANVNGPDFLVPDNVHKHELYSYLRRVIFSPTRITERQVDAYVLDRDQFDATLSLSCASPVVAYEGGGEIALSCTASGVPDSRPYSYQWSGDPLAAARLSVNKNETGPTTTATFLSPATVDEDKKYEYVVAVTAYNTIPATANVMVTVKNKVPVAVMCSGHPYSAYEGSANVTLDCTARDAPSGSSYVWTARGSTADTALLSATDIAAPAFDVPDAVDADKTYEYTLTVSAANAEDGTANVTVTVKNKPEIMIACAGDPYSAYEGSANVTLDCTASEAPGANPAYTYVWTARGSTADTGLLSAADIASPAFDVPDEVDADKTYEYTLTASAANAEDGTANVTVTVKDKPEITVACSGDPYSAYEGSADVTLDCTAMGLPSGSGSNYDYAWTSLGATADTGLLSATDVASPAFAVPDEVGADKTYEYRLTASAANAKDGTADVTVTVRNKPEITVACERPAPTYEGSENFALSCTASEAPPGSTYDYVWTARSPTLDTARLVAGADGPTPTFAVPEDVPQTTKYEYALAVSAANAKDGMANVTVTVLNTGALALVCADNPYSALEGEADITLACQATGAPEEGSDVAYAWTARGATADTERLSATDAASPMFAVPEEVPQTTRYEYRVTASAANAEDGTEDVTVTVLNRPEIMIACAGNPYSAYEGAADITLDCSAGDPGGADVAYSWTARGSTPDANLLSATDISSPVFDVPEEAPRTTTYEYLLTVTAEHAAPATEEVTVTVLNRPDIVVSCARPAPVYEGSPDIALSCSAAGAPPGSGYAYAWTARGSAADTGLLNATDILSPTFDVPEDVPQTTTYEYALAVSAENAEDGMANVTVTVLNTGALAFVCPGHPYSAYEGAADIALDCSVLGAPAGSNVAYAWTPLGSTPTGLLNATNIPSPMFAVPEDVPQTTTYEYMVTASAPDAEDAAANVTVTVLDRPEIMIACAGHPYSAYEGAADITLDCSATGAPEGSNVAYAWTPLGSTPTGLLNATDIPSPTFAVPEDVPQTTTYEYRLTASAPNAEDAAANVTVTVLNRPNIAVACAGHPYSAYEGAADIALDCSATGAPDGADYEYAWEARGSAPTGLLSATDISSPTFDVPDEVDETTRYEYRLTATAANAEDGTANVTVTVLNRPHIVVACANPDPVYEGSEDIALDCEASGAPDPGADYEYAWTARGATADTDRLSAADISSPTFDVPDEVDETTRYEYRLTASAPNAEDGTADVTVTVLNTGALALACPGNPWSTHEGSPDITLDCEASGAPDGSGYAYAWTARGATADTDLLSATDISSPTFYVPDEVDETTRYEYRVTATAENAEGAAADVTVTVLDRPAAPAPPAVAFSGDPTSLGVAVSASSLRFGAQAAGAQAALDPLTDRVSTSASGPYHAGRMTLAPDGSLAFDANGELALSIELVAPVALCRIADETAGETAGAATLALVPRWSIAASCEQLASEAIGGLRTQTTLSESDCRLLLFGGELDLSGAAPGRYAGNIDVILRTGAGVETHSVEAEVTVVAAPRVITIGPGGVRFDASREIPAALTEEQNLSVYPDMAFMTRDEPSGAFELSNPSLAPLEVSVSARFGYAEATEDGREIVVEDVSASRLGDLSEITNIYPTTLTLMPGERGVVRYGVREEALSSLSEAGYAAFFEVTSSPRRYARADRLPEGVVASDGTARVTLRVPGAYVPGEIAPRLKATLLSLSGGASPTATFLLETDGIPFAGEAAAYDGEGRALGRSETLTYARSRVRMSLDRLPEGEVVFLRFTPRGSGAAPEPVAVPWRAPQRDQRDIGAAQDSGVSPPPGAVLAEKP